MGTVVLFPAALTAEQHRQQSLFHRYTVALSTFLLRPSSENEVETRTAHREWITTFLGDTEDAKAIHRSLVNRLARMRQGARPLARLQHQPLGRLGGLAAPPRRRGPGLESLLCLRHVSRLGP